MDFASGWNYRADDLGIKEAYKQGVDLIGKRTAERIKASFDKVKITDEGHIQFNGDPHKTTEEAFAKYCRVVSPSFPVAYALQVPTDLSVYNLRKLTEQMGNRDVYFYLCNNTIVGVDSKELMDVPNLEILNSISALEGSDDWPSVSVGITPEYMVMDFITGAIDDIEPEVGDITQVGLRIRNSESGWFGSSAEVFFFRLSCSNGMVIPTKGFSFKRAGNKAKDVEKSLLNFSRKIAKVNIDTSSVVKAIQKATKALMPDIAVKSAWTKIHQYTEEEDVTNKVFGITEPDRQSMFEAIKARNKQHAIATNVRDGVLGGQLESPPPPPPALTELIFWDILNGITDLANDFDLRRKWELQAYAGRLLMTL